MITFRVLKPGQLLSLSYKYELSAWVYKQIERADSPFADFLHSKGYVLAGKRFKLFTFSDLYVPKYEILDDRIKILTSEISFVISFFVDRIAESMIVGAFQEGGTEFQLGDYISQLALRIENIQLLPLTIPDGVLRLKTTSPMVVSREPKVAMGEKYAQYLMPEDEDFEHYFFQNLLAKYNVAREHGLIAATDIGAKCSFRLLSKRPKSRKITVKAHQPDETQIRGCLFDFELEAPKALIELGLLSGFGVSNAMGFGSTRLFDC